MFRFEELGALFREISVFAKISGGGAIALFAH